MAGKKTKVPRNVLKDSEVSYYLTGESVLKASASPFPPKSKAPTSIRFTHSNSYGPVASEIFVRIGDPKSPLEITDFDTVSDWTKAKLTDDQVWSDEKEDWIPRPKKIQGETVWRATFQAELQFSPGKHLIEIKFLSAIKQVCSIVLSNWEVSVK